MQEKELYDKALKLLKQKDYTTKEMIDKLMSLENAYYPMVLELVAHLSKVNLIDDDLYARLYVGKAYNSSEGIYGIIKRLKEKGIDESIINKYIEEYTEEDEYNNALQVVENRYRMNTNKSLLAFKMDIKNRLFTKGFTNRTIDKISDKIDTLYDENKEHNILEKEAYKTYQQYQRRYAKEVLFSKMVQRLMQKGFDYNDAVNICNEIMKGEDEDETI